MKLRLLAAIPALSVLAACGGTRAAAPLPVVPAAAARANAEGAPRQFVGFWQSWSDTSADMAFARLGSVPGSVTTVDVAFSIADGNTIAAPQNTYPLAPGAAAIHARGGKLLLSLGGGTSRFAITDPAVFAANLVKYVAAKHGIYDGFDFDDEVIPNQKGGSARLASVILATRAAFPHAYISFDAEVSGADPVANPNSPHQGEDIEVLSRAGNAIDYVNVMAYDFYGWTPSGHAECSLVQGSANDCRLIALAQFAALRTPGGKPLSKAKVVLGLMIGKDDYGTIVLPGAAAGYARDVVREGYHGVMIWSLDRDNPQPLASGNGTGYPDGTYVKAIAAGLGT